MAGLTNMQAYTNACEIIKEAAGGGAFKLNGPSANTDLEVSKKAAERDAAYLGTLINSLAKSITAKTE
ncbi:hypothetical protein [Variovorax sp. WS11]|uniref:hypothetical protein n=1 Tax=Variovorax sp. WS11 TaxID=1105204 RepID=UPI0011B299E6|nr:hypothetical protein [Variovorax sp. WS11]NDZ12059.1 hypothetical protein [Variovorax sp. WS11]